MSDEIEKPEKLYRCSGLQCWELVDHPYEKCGDCKKPKWNFKIKKRHMNPYLPADHQSIDDLLREEDNED